MPVTLLRTIDDWVDERCDVSDTSTTTQASVLYSDFAVWRRELGQGRLTVTKWGRRMAKRFEKRKSHGVIRYLGVQLRY